LSCQYLGGRDEKGGESGEENKRGEEGGEKIDLRGVEGGNGIETGG